ncbi:MAG: DUF3800 domain-containing protein [Deltaproteobacteria bacterium]|nr:DUF3800 domain-containing protein [Deltaproteobacteria bacterium]
MHIYLDESGDLGFTFDQPFRKGGSSRYLTISFLLTPVELSHLPKRVVRKLYNKRKQSAGVELKGSHLTRHERVYFATQTGKLLAQHPEINVFSVTINKRTIKDPVYCDSGRLFNYVNRLILLDKIKGESSVTFIPDKRSIKAKNGNLLADYLQTALWFEVDSNTVVENRPQESHKALNLQFIDWVGHIMWKKYEDNEIEAYDILKRKVDLTPWWETLAGQW